MKPPSAWPPWPVPCPLLVFKTSYSRSAVINATQPDGTPIPFGATVSDDKGQDLAIVGQAGKLRVPWRPCAASFPPLSRPPEGHWHTA